MISFIQTYIYILAVCFFVSLTVYVNYRRTEFFLKLLPPFLFVALVVEILAAFMAFNRNNNVALYNFFTVFELCIYLLLVSLVITNERIKKIIRGIIFLYAIVAIINILFFQGLRTIHTITYSLGCLLVVSACIYYFLELFILPKSIKLRSNPAFWICFGIMLFYCCSFPLIGLINYWMNISKFLLKNFAHIVNILHILLYSLFIIAFLCRIRIRKYI